MPPARTAPHHECAAQRRHATASPSARTLPRHHRLAIAALLPRRSATPSRHKRVRTCHGNPHRRRPTSLAHAPSLPLTPSLHPLARAALVHTRTHSIPHACAQPHRPEPLAPPCHCVAPPRPHSRSAEPRLSWRAQLTAPPPTPSTQRASFHPQATPRPAHFYPKPPNAAEHRRRRREPRRPPARRGTPCSALAQLK